MTPPPGASPSSLAAAARTHWAAGRAVEAIAAFRKIAESNPASAEAQYDLGVALMGHGELVEASVRLRRALDLRPSLAGALHGLAIVQEQLGQETEAAELYRKLSRAAKTPAERRLHLGKALNLEGDFAGAEAELRRAAAAAPGHAGVQVLLGQMLLEKGEFAEGERMLLQALDEFPDAFPHLASARRMTPEDRPLLERAEGFLARGDLNPLQRGAVAFGLGKAYDDLADHGRAIAHYDRATALCGAARPLDRAGLAAYYDDLIAAYPKAAFAAARPQAPAEGDDLPVLIVGMPRSGTTLVEQILSSHPQVAGGGELPFWTERCKQWQANPAPPPATPSGAATGLDRVATLLTAAPARSAVELAMRQAPRPQRTPVFGHLDRAMMSAAARDYLALLRRIGPDALRVTDKAPQNFERLGHILTALPRARIIHCRRRPIDTCLSIYFTNFKGRQGWSREDILFQYRQYERLMAHWRSVLPPDAFTEVDYEDVVADREGETRRLVSFCGLDWDPACLAPEANRRVVKTASLWQARQPTYRGSLDRWRNYEPWLGALRELAAGQALPP